MSHTASAQQPTGSTTPIVGLTELLVAGLTSATIAAITSLFGWPGTLMGAAFTAMVTTAIATTYKAYLNSMARVVFSVDRPPPPPSALLADRPPPPPLAPWADRPAPPPLRPTSRARRVPGRIRVLAAFEWFAFRTSPERRRWVFSRVLLAGVAAFIIGMGVVTAVELRLGGNLPCALWDTDCSAGGNPPSILAPFYAICRG
jgi:hypothetical protein